MKMAVMDFVVPVVKLKQSLSFDMKDLFKAFQSLLKERGYKIEEREYSESSPADNEQKTHFLWKCEKKVDYYTKQVIEIKFLADSTHVVIEQDDRKKAMQEGNVSVAIGGYIEKDIEDDWALKVKTGFDRFVRELYDKFGKGPKFEEYEGKLRKDIEAVVFDIKTYLKMHRFD